MTPRLRRLPSLALTALALTALALLGGAVVAPLGSAASAQESTGERVLVFSRTTGFRHASIEIGVETVRALGAENGFEVEATEDPTAFTDEGLAGFDAVVWLNTTGNVLDDGQRAAFERYVRGGGAWVGVHSAADTEYTSTFYEGLLGGARFLSHPIQQPGTLLKEPPDHPSTAHLGEQWELPFEEFYSFVQSPRPNVRVLLTIDEDSYEQDPNTGNLPDNPTFPEGVSGVMGDHPMSWCLPIDDGRAWYTALGHEPAVYLLPDFRQHLLGGILTAVGRLGADCAPVTTQQPAASPEPSPAASPSTGSAPAAAPGRQLPATGPEGVSVAALVALGVALALQRRARRAAP